MINTATFKFMLESYTGPHSRHTCPKCGASHEFSRYIDTENGNTYLDDSVGKCNRTNNCNYHYTPKQYFADNGFTGDFKKQPFKSRKARSAAALARVFSIGATPTPAPEPKDVSEGASEANAKKLERLQSQMKQYQAAFENSPAREYLQQRGISPETAQAFGCGYSQAWEHWEKDKEEHWQLTGTDRRVVFPITDPEGNVLAVHGRAIDTEFFNSPKITKGSRKEALFQPANAFDADIIFLCEGPADAMALHECGFAAVASVATSIPSWLPNRRAFRKVFVAMDADETGDKSADKHINELRAHGARAVRLRPEGAKDWNEMLLKTSADALRNFIQVKISEAFPDYELQTKPETSPEIFVREIYVEPGEALKSLHQSPYFTGWTNANLF
jgi:DNA primase